MVTTALGRVRRRAIESMPWWRRALGAIDPRERSILVGAIIVGFLAIGVVVMIFVVRTKDPVRTGVAPYDKLVWSDVEDGGETTIALIHKDPERERGRKLCVTGAVDSIEKTTIDNRPVHAGTLRSADGESVKFIAIGSTRSVITRYAGRLCGVANGKAVIGLFDLPENRRLER